ncbi:homeobox domain-containing protein [Aspergillus homomorphus CBS 101889]|uniref:Putative homeobox transcription factor n=1 Tax=Aspergillus homomorphus (strain CBS 101889) TaxID=1450537 RepID=A0A395HU00_ASPHC|nr:putative homeobox transcription factor [Aspergillus homomorphus CBS 101889]RAL11432.1 putative homeobox transcription factor [Aspergillus homomorphus CBS 101889]
MNYLHHPYAFTGVPMDQPVAFDPTMTHPAMMHPMDGYLYPHPPFDMVDFYHQPIMDYDEYAENLSRPRLTKEQVETLEAQFQAHPKPSSNVKRQLAAQTNLSLPRVANWFQNRRAKAKQQKRQEEFERMQKAKAEAEEAARGKSDNAESSSESNQDSKTSNDEAPEDTPKPTTEKHSERTKTTSSSSRSKHQKTRSESAREATFASLQRALNAAVAARDRYSHDGDNSHPASLEGSVSPTTTFAANTRCGSHDEQRAGSSDLSTPYTQTTLPWESSQTSLEYVTAGGESLAVPTLENPHSMQFHPAHTEDWAGHMHSSAKPVPGYRSASDAEASYNTVQYPMHQDLELSRRASSDELADSFEGIGINPSQGLSHVVHEADRDSWKEAGKELDLAARRKRPRPAAIGTSRSSSMLSSSSALSPTSRLPGYGSIRHSKSAQGLNSRYAGVRKASAAQRSPLNLSTFAEAGSLNSKSSMLQPTATTGGLAPPTPLTPEDLHHLLPNTPSDGGYCLSAQPTSGLFPTTQPMQINIASPPATPLAVDMLSGYPFQGVVPPMSAPAHYNSFPDYASCEASMTGRSWPDATSMSSPEASFQSPCQVTSQPDMAPMSYDHSGEHVPVTGSPSLVYTTADVDMPMSAALGGDSKPTEFIYEFPEQQEAQRFGAQQLPSQKPEAYTFNNKTPNDF